MADQRNWLTPYNFVQNNPINRIAPDGAFDTEDEAKDYARQNNIKTGWFRRNKIEQGDDGVWAINNKKEHTSTSNSEFGVMTGALVTATAPGLIDTWSNAMSTESDANAISFGGNYALGGGIGFELSAVRINKGVDKGWHFYGTFNLVIGLTSEAGLTVNSVDYNETNSIDDPLDRDLFTGKSNAFSGNIPMTYFGGSYSWTPVERILIQQKEFQLDQVMGPVGKDPIPNYYLISHGIEEIRKPIKGSFL
ncbi:hypothetical protein [Marinilongibacter aquaticus]|uniref:hypothetical protein n=1 Tax=Marinilongibacter aquaticus TaxID=2975157 RepID=UPI0021BDA292|nr:hypothetical protein [Marinilongibacter aquaticus]